MVWLVGEATSCAMRGRESCRFVMIIQYSQCQRRQYTMWGIILDFYFVEKNQCYTSYLCDPWQLLCTQHSAPHDSSHLKYFTTRVDNIFTVLKYGVSSLLGNRPGGARVDNVFST